LECYLRNRNAPFMFCKRLVANDRASKRMITGGFSGILIRRASWDEYRSIAFGRAFGLEGLRVQAALV
jgi:hypothetical protein